MDYILYTTKQGRLCIQEINTFDIVFCEKVDGRYIPDVMDEIGLKETDRFYSVFEEEREAFKFGARDLHTLIRELNGVVVHRDPGEPIESYLLETYRRYVDLRMCSSSPSWQSYIPEPEFDGFMGTSPIVPTGFVELRPGFICREEVSPKMMLRLIRFEQFCHHPSGLTFILLDVLDPHEQVLEISEAEEYGFCQLIADVADGRQPAGVFSNKKIRVLVYNRLIQGGFGIARP